MSFVIAIDGTFASGKGTLARKLADHYGLAYLDTGKIYRALAARAMTESVSLDDGPKLATLAARLNVDDLDDPILKSGIVGANASKVAALPAVRAALLDFQRHFAQNPGKNADGEAYRGAVLDGRDIGTVICPDADIKLYVDASPAERAERRYQELLSYGEDVTLDQIRRQLDERDGRDMTRKHAPLKPAENAHLLDTTNLSIDAAFEAAKNLIDAVLSL
ncbi:MAG TPA: (d)CMP kinase [Hellea balneolensis]|uniref:Cytidylate kinase n=1 Tax=Hellea balneolensis TaxID=287478 RepID=A0A7C5M058_9PROT|nr:(d)CMP kinase [Hellea balneolensis]